VSFHGNLQEPATLSDLKRGHSKWVTQILYVRFKPIAEGTMFSGCSNNGQRFISPPAMRIQAKGR